MELMSVWKIGFKYNEGIFKWFVMPFNLTSAPTVFMRMMDDILLPFKNTFMVIYNMWHPHINQNLGRVPEPDSKSTKHTSSKKVICYTREVLIWNETNSMFGVYHGYACCACVSNHDPIHV